MSTALLDRPLAVSPAVSPAVLSTADSSTAVRPPGAPVTRARGALVVAALTIGALALLLVGGAIGTPGGSASSPHLIVQFGVSAATAAAIVNALTSWWSVALSLVLVPLGLGFAALTIRATWTTLLRTLGKVAATAAMKRF